MEETISRFNRVVCDDFMVKGVAALGIDLPLGLLLAAAAEVIENDEFRNAK
jgi:hypothetical protein